MKTVDIFYMAEIRPDGEVEAIYTLFGRNDWAQRIMDTPGFLEQWTTLAAPGNTLQLIKVSVPFEVVELPTRI